MALFCGLTMTASAQKGKYTNNPQNTIQPVTTWTFTYENPAGTTITLDTLTDADTGYVVYTGLRNTYNVSANVTIAQITGTVAGTAVLQGSDDADFTTPYNITGTATQCAGCVGASQTLTTGTNTYKWIVPSTPFRYHRIRVITTGTSTATYTSALNYYKW